MEVNQFVDYDAHTQVLRMSPQIAGFILNFETGHINSMYEKRLHNKNEEKHFKKTTLVQMA